MGLYFLRGFVTHERNNRGRGSFRNQGEPYDMHPCIGEEAPSRGVQGSGSVQGVPVCPVAYADQALEGRNDNLLEGPVLHLQSETVADGIIRTN